jgi:hypothetical protein
MCAPLPRRRSRGSRSLKPIDTAVRRLDDLYNEGGFEHGQRAYKVLRCCLTAADLREPGAVYQTPSATLEKLTGYRPRSISAAYTDLVRAGLIERHVVMEGRRDPEWSTVLTPKCWALFFGDHSQSSAPPLEIGLNTIVGEGAVPPAIVDKSTEQPERQQPEQPQSEQPRPPEPVEGQAIHIRDDLKPLLQVLQPAEVKKALGIAKAADVWVQDVMAHRLPAILAAKEPMGLLIHLIDSGQDWKRPVVIPGQRKQPVSSESANSKADKRNAQEQLQRQAENQKAIESPPEIRRQSIQALRQQLKATVASNTLARVA